VSLLQDDASGFEANNLGDIPDGHSPVYGGSSLTKGQLFTPAFLVHADTVVLK